MKNLFSTALVAAALCGSANADFVFDDFSAPQTVSSLSPGAPVLTGPGVERTITIPALPAPFTSVFTGGGNFEATGTAVGSAFNMSYALATPFDLHSSGAFAGNPLVLDLFATVSGAWDLVVTYSSSTTGESASFAPVAITAPGPQLVGLDGTTLGRGALASTVDTISLDFAVTAVDGLSFVATFGNTAASIAAVPEPASIALLGLTGIAGVIGVRRRRKNQEVA